MYRYSESELKKVMKGFTIIIDGREKENSHITNYLKEFKKPFELQTITTGDYASYIKKNPDLGIMRDIYIPAKIERKAHWSEITGNLQKSTETRFINELIRSQEAPFTILIEDPNGYANLLAGNYNSNYKPLSLLARMNTFKAKYGFELVYMDPKYSGNFLWHHLYYHALHYIKNMPIEIYKPEQEEITA